VTPGILIVDKERGPTSHDVVARVRRLLKTREVGHAGTLDPMATGVLVVALGEATKLVPYLTNAAKTYEARLELGRETDTLDAMGDVTGEAAIDDALLGAFGQPIESLAPLVREARDAEIARTLQDPPIYSAIQQDGERAYARARRGEDVVLEPRVVRVHDLRVTAMGLTPRPWIDLRVTADKGYYVRSLGRDLARGLGSVGHLVALRRLDSGGFTVGDAVSLAGSRETIEPRIVSLADAARRALPAATLTDEGVREARFGRRVKLEDIETTAARGEPCAWFDREGTLVAVGIVEDDGRVVRGFGPSGAPSPAPPLPQ